MKLFVLGMTCLAGSIIYMTIDVVGIRGLKFVHYALMAYATIGAVVAWCVVWPSRKSLK